MKTIKSSTIRSYELTLNSLVKKVPNINNIEETLELIEKMNLKDSTKKAYIVALIDFYKKKQNNTEELKKLRELLEIYSNKINSILVQNIKSDKEEQNFIKWNSVLEIRDRLQKLSEGNTKESMIYTYYYLILSLYTRMPPRRILDYSNLYYKNDITIEDESNILYLEHKKISQKIKNKKKGQDLVLKVNDSKNYFGKYRDIYVFIFNNYKTYGTYGTQILEVDKDLVETILRYVNYKEKKLGGKEQKHGILNVNSESLIKKLKKIFKIYVNKNISASLLRHIYITENLDKVSVIDKEIISLKMGHSNYLQSLYKKLGDVKEVAINIADENKLLGLIGNKNSNKYNDEERRLIKKIQNRKNYINKIKQIEKKS